MMPPDDDDLEPLPEQLIRGMMAMVEGALLALLVGHVLLFVQALA
ncbi:MAG: hypothetical protein SNJ79_05930 [Sphingomonadaceae bacterium]